MPWEDSAPNAGFTASTQSPWLPVPPEHIAASVEHQQADPSSQLQQTRALVKMHTETAAFHTDKLDIIDGPKEMLVFVRGVAPNAALCMFNISGSPQTMVRPPEWRDANVVTLGGKISVDEGNEKETFNAWSWQILTTH